MYQILKAIVDLIHPNRTPRATTGDYKLQHHTRWTLYPAKQWRYLGQLLSYQATRGATRHANVSKRTGTGLGRWHFYGASSC